MGRQFLPRDINLSRRALWVLEFSDKRPPSLGVSRKCPESVLGVSRTLFRHSGPLGTLTKGPEDTPWDTPLDRGEAFLGGRLGYFLFFSGRGGGRGSSRRREGGGIGFYWKSQGGWLPGREGPRGREGVCGELGSLGGGGAKYFFFSGPKCTQSVFYLQLELFCLQLSFCLQSLKVLIRRTFPL